MCSAAIAQRLPDLSPPCRRSRRPVAAINELSALKQEAVHGRSGSDHGGSGCDSAIARDWKLRRSFLSDRLELRLLLVAQLRIEVPERGADQIDRLLHRSEPPVHGIEASGWW